MRPWDQDVKREIFGLSYPKWEHIYLFPNKSHEMAINDKSALVLITTPGKDDFAWWMFPKNWEIEQGYGERV